MTEKKSNIVHTFHIGEGEAIMIHGLVASHMATLKNWIVSKVERMDWDGSATLVKELREYEKLYACFNMEAKRQIAETKGDKMTHEHFTMP